MHFFLSFFLSIRHDFSFLASLFIFFSSSGGAIAWPALLSSQSKRERERRRRRESSERSEDFLEKHLPRFHLSSFVYTPSVKQRLSFFFLRKAPHTKRKKNEISFNDFFFFLVSSCVQDLLAFRLVSFFKMTLGLLSLLLYLCYSLFIIRHLKAVFLSLFLSRKSSGYTAILVLWKEPPHRVCLSFTPSTPFSR